MNDFVGFRALLICNSDKTSLFNSFIARLFENRGNSNIKLANNSEFA